VYILKDDKISYESLINSDSHEEIGNYFTYLDTISKALSKRLDELEIDNKRLKNDISQLENEYYNKDLECKEYKAQIEIINLKYLELEGKNNELIDKYENHQKRYKLLEVENARNMDEMKNLRKENKLLLSQSNVKDKETIMKRIKRLIK
jgi:chromosome segregation ATPase